jgi:hypothetical protein
VERSGTRGSTGYSAQANIVTATDVQHAAGAEKRPGGLLGVLS